jgi:hypothetical protein
VNDEDFARSAFVAAFRAGEVAEPDVLPDLDRIAAHGRHSARSRQGIYAAGTVALAGAVTAGVVSGPSLLGLGSGSPKLASGSQPSGAPTSASASKSVPDGVKPSPGVPCATPPAINWATVVNAALPTGMIATADHSATCVQLPDGTRTVEALFKLSTGNVELQVNVGTGPSIAAKLGEAPGGFAGVSPAPGSGSFEQSSASASLDPAALASLQAQKRALEGTAKGASAPGATPGAGVKGAAQGSCSKVGPDENMCVSHLTKDSLSVVDVEILRTGARPLVVDVAASNGKNLSTAAPAQLPSDATMLVIAQAVAAHF